MPEANRQEKLKTLGLLAFVSGAFTGYFPFASGTVGSALAVGFIWLFRDTPLFFRVVLAVFLLGAGVLACQRANKYFKKADSSRIVIDEIVGMMITMLGIPITGYWLLLGFLLFRFFDVAKFPPADFFDTRWKNGWGVMLDDVVAGIYSNIILHLMVKTSI